MRNCFICSLAVLLFCLGNAARADQPRLDLNGGTGFPAISKDRKNIVIFDFHPWYDDTLRFALQFLSTESHGKIQSVPIWDGPSKDMPTSKSAAEAIRKANSILAEQPYTQLNELKITQDPTLPTGQIAKTGHLKITYLKNSLKVDRQDQKTFETKLPDMIRTGWCCGEESPQKHCKVSPTLFTLNIDEKEEFLLISFGLTSGPDGCEQGPAYKLLKLN